SLQWSDEKVGIGGQNAGELRLRRNEGSFAPITRFMQLGTVRHNERIAIVPGERFLIFVRPAKDRFPPIADAQRDPRARLRRPAWGSDAAIARDRKSTRLNSSDLVISYAVFCLK